MSTEKRARLNEIVSVDPELMHGTPCFRGTRVPVRLLLDDLKSGFTIDEFLAGCPTVSREFVEGYLELAQDRTATAGRACGLWRPPWHPDTFR
jgi:uncharacterized protein (DUF433 family)